MFKGLFSGGEPQATLERSRAELQLKTEANGAWGLGKMQRWDVDLDVGIITFTDADKIATAPVQVIGTYNTKDGTWLWGWDHPSIKEEFARSAQLCRDFGEKHRMHKYTERKIACSEEDAWQFTALATHLSGASGAYRGPSETTYVFMTFGEVTLQKVQ